MNPHLELPKVFSHSVGDTHEVVGIRFYIIPHPELNGFIQFIPCSDDANSIIFKMTGIDKFKAAIETYYKDLWFVSGDADTVGGFIIHFGSWSTSHDLSARYYI